MNITNRLLTLKTYSLHYQHSTLDDPNKILIFSVVSQILFYRAIMFFFVFGSCEFCLISSFPVAVASIGFICCCAFPCSRELPGICELNAWDIILFRSLEQFVPLLGNVFFRAIFPWTSSSLLKMAQNHQRCFRATAMGRRYGCSFF